MQHNESLTLLKAVADPSRLRLLDALLDGPQCLEELSQRLGLAPSTVSFHLKKLESAGLLFKVREQYYTVYTLNGDRLNLRLRDLVDAPEGEKHAQAQRLDQRRLGVLKSFFDGERLTQLPVQKKKRRMVLDVFASDFEAGRDYAEQEVNRIIQRRHEDHCLIRRLLVDEGNMTREQGVYRLLRPASKAGPLPATTQRNEKAMKTTDRKKALKQEYKMRPLTAGVWKITCQANGRFLLGSNLDMHAPFNRHRAMLTIGSHRYKAMQEDWNTHGPNAFTFEVLESVQEKGDPGFDLARALKEMEEKWAEALAPFMDQAYNEGGKFMR